jgi:hypothetical protein
MYGYLLYGHTQAEYRATGMIIFYRNRPMVYFHDRFAQCQSQTQAAAAVRPFVVGIKHIEYVCLGFRWDTRAVIGDFDDSFFFYNS